MIYENKKSPPDKTGGLLKFEFKLLYPAFTAHILQGLPPRAAFLQ